MPEMVRLYVAIPTRLMDRLNRQCERRVVSRGLIVRRALERLLDELEDEHDMLDDQIERDR